MAATTPSKRPTDAELAILGVLWERGGEPCTVREIYEHLARQRQIGYTTVLKLLQIMTVKGLVKRDETSRTHTYRAAMSEDQTQRRLVRDLIARAFGGSARKLVMHALDAAKASPKEMQEIRELLESKSRESKSREADS